MPTKFSLYLDRSNFNTVLSRSAELIKILYECCFLETQFNIKKYTRTWIHYFLLNNKTFITIKIPV